jgi:hypothetical protein
VGYLGESWVTAKSKKNSPSSGESVVLRIALYDLVEEFARDHERDASFGRIGTLHRVHIAEARGASEVPAPARALDGVVGKRYMRFCCPPHGQYSEASMTVIRRVVFSGSLGSSLPY